jgi:FkbM family methyltransferase
MIPDSLLPYLIGNDIPEEFYYALMDMTSEGPYEYKMVRLEKGDTVIDAGANVGFFSALAAVNGCSAYAFEPMPRVIKYFLSDTARLNPGIQICRYALSDKAEELIFNDNGLTDSSFMSEKTSTEIKRTKVHAIDLDSFAETNKLARIDFIKADIEGAERYMLKGARRVLREFAPKIAVCTYHLPDDPQVLREIILEANPNYIIEERWKKLYAYVPK